MGTRSRRRRQPATTPRRGRPPGQVRIVGGRWRGRRLPVADAAGLRPTGDRVRETLFNWLVPVIAGTRCLDLFAGTGALGLEALSRGAAEAWFVECDVAVAAQLKQTIRRLDCESAHVRVGDATLFLAGTSHAFDIVFLDPPFNGPGLGNLCTLLGAGWLAPGALIYLEMSRGESVPRLPPGWELLREQTAGQVRFALARRVNGL